MKICYIVHPIGGNVEENLERIRLIVRDINLSYADVVPFAPYWLDCHALHDGDPQERERGFKNNTAILSRGMVDELWVYGDRISNGVWSEIQLAQALNIPVIAKTEAVSRILNELSIH